MSIYKVILSTESKKELRAISLKHLELVGEHSSAAITSKITDSLKLLADNPYMGMDAKKLGIRKISYRYIICGNYLCFYKVDRKNTIVEIAHIVDGRTDYIKNFE